MGSPTKKDEVSLEADSEDEDSCVINFEEVWKPGKDKDAAKAAPAPAAPSAQPASSTSDTSADDIRKT